MPQSSAIAAVQHELMSSEDSQEGKEYLPSSSHSLQPFSAESPAGLFGEPWGNPGCENTR